jgi:pimeloyl-ACP methyl ester carboxylesterase
VRKELNLGKVALMGHSFGGVLAQAYALKYQQNLSKLILCSTFYSTSKMNEVFQKQLAAMSPELRKRCTSKH